MKLLECDICCGTGCIDSGVDPSMAPCWKCKGEGRVSVAPAVNELRDLRAASRLLFPNWSRRMRAKWVVAKIRAARMPQRWCQMVPMTIDQIPPRSQFVSRTEREAFQ